MNMICDVSQSNELLLKSVKYLYGSSAFSIFPPRPFTIIDMRDLHIVVVVGGDVLRLTQIAENSSENR